ncbi:ethanolamine ammonia-lyase subunit EutC [uncultured Chitinophaga sp.]|jgi:Ethanolamine ammonia-lyase, small subunit|uniref:ethanolamine ammonia-lyase subunit EutC n=1 Tax=uncultured Chitinophaga sp. TaxID=339340 RepID=UPI002607455F|nr:ethanolamine ammonia-lyase subunit EutC [uncultured Chitinophaga sp.]
MKDPWLKLRAFTPARIALGRTGTSVPMDEVLRFRLAHAHARDAVYSLADIAGLQEQLLALQVPVQVLHSRAADRHEYLQRPDKGRRLDEVSAAALSAIGGTGNEVVIVIADGLSATAVNRHAVPLLQQLLPMLSKAGIALAPVCIVQQGRVAVGDEAGALLRAKAVLVFIGERPGLSSPDSLGIYLTFQPKPGLTDEARNCISNIRPEGLPYKAAAEKAFYLLSEALRLQLSGVHLKDNEQLLS